MISKLRAFMEVAKTKNLTKAAENTFTSQPSISMKIKSLEDELGTKLFDRSKKMMILNEEGKNFLRYAEQIIHLYDEAITVINDFNDLNRGTLAISSGSYFGSYLLPELLGIYKARFPKIDIQIKIAFSQIVIENVIMNNHELGIIGETDLVNKYPNLLCHPFFNDELLLICSVSHPCAKLEEIELTDLKEETFIKSDKSSALLRMIEEHLRAENIEFKHSIILSNVEAIKRSVENNLGVTILPKLSVEREVELGLLKGLPIKNMNTNRRLFFIYRKDRVLSQASKEFLKMSLRHFQGEDFYYPVHEQ
ncbi:LysR substrate-binding domain-containing protein [Salirhabdus salicampi]|uniref:LysR substrate-binding domain-containing protein n=1 Tax=Salirhabdus salicampi TaxID=476102 RepID=UPI0020C441D2|nr:LysR substrate-binding domain-containing protein [Salirhabdus salicampi]MCP8615830.1 LysR substrate-binding domain-containing protein [Salirhabdus salicampi]